MKTLYSNANIQTMDDAQPTASCMLVEDGRILRVGDEAPQCAVDQIVDLKGGVVYPAFIESHAHIKNTGLTAKMLNLVGKDKVTILNDLAKAVDQTPEGEIILGRGWNQANWGGDMPSKAELDAISLKHPVVFTRMCGHSLWCNSMTLGRAGIDDHTPDPKGGHIVHDEHGKATGILEEYAMSPVWALIDHSDEAAYVDAQQYFYQRGITTVVDAGISDDEIQAYDQLYDSGQLTMQTYAMIHADHMDGVIEQGIKTDRHKGRFDLRSVKFLLDGSLGQRSAWMLEDYADREGYRGVHVYEYDELFDQMRRAHQRGFQIAIHVIGDAALEQALRCFERLPLDEVRARRHRLEHFQTASHEQIQRAARMRLIASMQPVHLTDDIQYMRDRLGSYDKAFRIKDMMDEGMTLCFGSDTPVMGAEPFHSIHGAVYRTAMNDDSEVADATQRISVMDALRAFTTEAAYAMHQEHRLGKLAKGYVADFVVLDRDPLHSDKATLKDIQVSATYRAGEKVYERQN